MKERAYFVFRPRTVADLGTKNQEGKWQEYRIVKTICLNRIDYENFITDMLADRLFIEDNAVLCIEPGDCLLVFGKQQKEELLIIPWHDGFVHYAALRPTIRLLDDEKTS